jgi:DNA-binding winged helix-turn-helix (wHTH) protein
MIGPFRVGEWLVEPSLGRLSHGEGTVQLELKVMDVLVCLAARPGQLVTRKQLTDRVWATEFIADNTLTHAVAELRDALGDDARQPAYIETIHRRGYRLLAAVTDLEPEVRSRPGAASCFRLLGPGGEVGLAPGDNLIGRDADADVVIDSAKVSRRHARIVVDDGGAVLEDLGSKNGTFLNGERLGGPAHLAHGDEIRIGRGVARLRFAEVGDRTVTETSSDH